MQDSLRFPQNCHALYRMRGYAEYIPSPREKLLLRHHLLRSAYQFLCFFNLYYNSILLIFNGLIDLI